MPVSELIQVLQQKRETLRRLQAQAEAVEREIETLTAAIKILEETKGPMNVAPVLHVPDPAASVHQHEPSHQVPATGTIRKAFP